MLQNKINWFLGDILGSGIPILHDPYTATRMKLLIGIFFKMRGACYQEELNI